jgi:Zn-dependent peptidase ImmA (M78 family)
MNHRKIESAVESLLRKYDIKKPPVPVKEIALREGLQVKYHELEDHVSGLLIDRRDTPIIAVNVHHHSNRQRFTIAHELAHFVLHRGDPTVFVDQYLVHLRTDPKGEDTVDPREVEANKFAASLLMPKALLTKDLARRTIELFDDGAITELAGKYQVSVQALLIRLDRLQLLSA